MEVREVLRNNLDKVRGELTHSEFASRLGLNRTTLYLYESGKRIIPTELIYKIYTEFGVTPNEMYNVNC